MKLMLKSYNLVGKLVATLLVLSVSFLCFGGVATAAVITGHQFAGDVNGDGKADAVTFDSASGDWWVAPAGGQAFSTPTRWISGFGVGSTKQFVSDVSGDGKADIVTFDANNGDWWIATSNGTSFGAGGVSRWISGHGVGSTNQLINDINGDGKADAVVFFDNGSWWAGVSGGTSFQAPGNWFIGGHGVGSTKQFVTDVTGDGKADAVVFSSQSNDWYVSNSDGVRFATGPNRWAANVGLGSSDQFLSDVSGDGKADAILAFPWSPNKYGGDWWVATSNGATFNTATNWLLNQGYGMAKVVFRDVYSTSNTDLIMFDANSGDWWVYPANNSSFVTAGASRWISGFGVGT